MKPHVLRIVVVGVSCFAAGWISARAWKPGEAPTAPALATPSKASDRSNTTAANAAPVAARTKRSVRPERIHYASPVTPNHVGRESADARLKVALEGALQLDNPALKNASLETIRREIESEDPATAAAALSAFSKLYDVDFDKGSFRPVLEKHLKSSDPAVRCSAWFGLLQCGKQPGDAELLRESIRAGELDSRASYLLFRFEDGDLTGESGEVVRGMLDPADRENTTKAIQPLWGAKLSPELEADIIALSREPGYLHDTVYYVLSTQQNKSAATVALLVDLLAQPQGEMSGRAAWGLQQGVSAEVAPPVADVALRIVSSRASGYLNDNAWKLLQQCAGPSHLSELRQLAGKPNLPPARLKEVEAIISRIEGAPPSPK